MSCLLSYQEAWLVQKGTDTHPGGVVCRQCSHYPICAQTSWLTLGVMESAKFSCVFPLLFIPAPFPCLILPNITVRIPGEKDEREEFSWIFIITEVQPQLWNKPKSRGNWSFRQDSILKKKKKKRRKTIQFDYLTADSVLEIVFEKEELRNLKRNLKSNTRKCLRW